MTPDQIVEVLESSHDEQQPALILCASEATRQQVMRELLAARSSWAGLRVQTLNSAARTLASKSLHPEEKLESLPEDHVWFERLQNRPLLCQQLAEHVGVLHRMKALGLDIDTASEPLRSLVAAQWAVPDDITGWQALVEMDGPVLGVGFAGGAVGSGCGRLGAVEAHVLAKHGVPRVEPNTVDGIDALSVTDVASEARVAVALLDGCSDGLVLVADAETGQRVAATLRRNGVSVAEDGAVALKDHALVSLCRRLLPCFESQGTELISAQDLIGYLTHPALSRRSIKRGTDVEEEQVEELVDRASVRGVRTLLRSTRRYHATVAEWVTLIDDQLAQTQRNIAADAEDETIARHQRYMGTIHIVRGHLQTLAEQVDRGTLGAMGTLISKRCLSNADDKLGYAIIGALGGRSLSLANRENLDLALSGATSGVRVGDGVTVLRYEEYDGRSAANLVLLDVHHKGLGKAPTPSALMQDADHKCMGLPLPTIAVDERMALARWAVARAERSHAVVTDADATGRRVVAPVQLKLRLVDAESALGGAKPERYGHALRIPESTQRAQLASGASGTDESRARAQQVSAEWVRAGYREESIAVPKLEQEPKTLLDYLDQYDVRPPRLRPWLGEVGQAKGSDNGLPSDFRLSASKLEVFTGCMYVAWAERVLGLREPDTLDEEVNARELGQATHAVLESYVKQHTFQRVVKGAQCDQRRDHLAQHCVSITEDQVRAVREKKGAHVETAAASVARQGLTRRWQQQWAEYAEKRIGSAEAETTRLQGSISRKLGTAAGLSVVEELCPSMGKMAKEDVGKALRAALAIEPSLAALRANLPQTLASRPKLTQDNQDKAMDAVNGESSAGLLALIQDAERLWKPSPHPDGDGLFIDAELAFGSQGETLFSLGQEPIPISGYIDTIVKWRTAQDEPSLEIADFKTGGEKSGGTVQEVREWLTKPQLSFYALVVRAGLVNNVPDLPVTKLSYDMVKITNKNFDPIGIDDSFLDYAHSVYGSLMDRARQGDFSPIPHPQWSPYKGGHQSDIFDASRIRPNSLPDHSEDGEDAP